MIDLQGCQVVVSLIDLNCQKYYAEPAVILEGQQLTYGELQQRTEHLFQYLTVHGWLKPNSLVGLCIEPSFEMVIAIYAIWKAGAAFVPLDPDFPQQRLSYMIGDAKLTTILTQQKFAFDIEPAMRQSGLNGQMCFLDNPTIWEPLSSGLPSGLPSTVDPEQLAYIIYTSGSTGVPKGVMLGHRGLLNFAQASCNTFNITPGLRLLQFASISFDAAVWELVTALCAGATLVLGPREQMLPGQPLANFMARQQVQWAFLAPSVLATLTPFRDQLPDLQTLVIGGEVCPISLAKTWVSSSTRFFHAYGPTETTICCTFYEFKQQDTSLPIGCAIPNVECYVLDDNLKLCNRGEKGELYVGGVGVGKGYLNKPELTSSRFLDNPFGPGKIYKTGDIAYEDPDKSGLFYYAGRSDHQVKIRGKRIQIEAIEIILAQHPGIQTIAVKAIRTTELENNNMPENSGVSMLVAYVVPKPGQFLTESHIQRFAAEQLPDYMIPTRFVFMDELPLLPNRSKVNRNALPELPQFTSFVTDQIDISLQIAVFFDEALQLPAKTCKPHTNFFEIGGSSLCIAYVLSALERDFGVSIPSRLIYEYPTPSGLAQLLEQFQIKGESREGLVNNKPLKLEAEARLSSDLNTSIWQQPAQAKYDCALITGATGFLGAHLLHELLIKGTYDKVYCLVRAETEKVAIERLHQTFLQYQLPTAKLAQVNVIAGDIEQSQFQLPTMLFNKLCEEVSQIYHVAADTNYIKPYSLSKKPNLDGTANILDLTARRCHKMLHYISTVAVYGAVTSLLGVNEVSEDYDIDCSLPIMSVEHGYVQSKWAAERIVNLAREKGLAVSIYRPGFISGHRETGATNVNDTFYRFVSGCIEMGMYPDWPEKYWTPVPVDYVASVIAHISSDTKYTGGNYNIVVQREQELSNVEIFDSLNELVYSLQKISPKNWLNALSTLPTTNPLHPLTSFFQEKVYQNRSTIMEVHHRTPICQIDNTLKALQGSGILGAKFDKELIREYLPKFDRDFSSRKLEKIAYVQ